MEDEVVYEEYALYLKRMDGDLLNQLDSYPTYEEALEAANEFPLENPEEEYYDIVNIGYDANDNEVFSYSM